MLYKQKIAFLLIFTLYNAIYAQNICGSIMYKETSDIALFFQTITITEFNKEAAYTEYLHYKKAKEFLSGEYDLYEVNEGEELVLSTNKGVAFLYTNNSNTYFTDTWWKKTLLVKEDAFSWNWQLLGDTKKIGKFNCQNASIAFRGRTFIAWFTTDIPISFGPRRFKGLPGLILEVYDSKELWNMHAIKINLKNSKKKCPINFDTEKLKKAINVKTYLKKVDSLYLNDIKKEMSKYPKGSSGIKLPKRCDRYYNGHILEIYKKQ